MAKKEKESKSKTEKTEYRGVRVFHGKKGPTYEINYVNPMTDQRVRKVLKAATSAEEASGFRSAEILDAKRGLGEQLYNFKGKPKAVLFSDMIDEYLEWSRENKKSWATDKYRAKALREAFEKKLASDLTPFMVEKFKIQRSKEVTRQSVNKELILGTQVFKKAAMMGTWKGRNPFAEVDKLQVTKGKKPGALTPDEVRAIRDAITHPTKKDMVEFAFYAGWRISEIRRLKWEDVNLEEGAAWITDPKNRNTVQIELSDAALEIIKRQPRRGEYVFTMKNGKNFKSNIHKVLKNAAQTAGVALPPRKAWHIFRRTWASMMLQSGCDVETLRVMGNWKDHGMPLWYAEAAVSEKRRETVNRLPGLDEKIGDDGKMEENGKVVNLTIRND